MINREKRDISLKVDYAFKRVFGDERNIGVLKYLLNTILEYSDDELEDISILNSEMSRDYYYGKEARLDILARLKNGEYVNIEMQVNSILGDNKRFLLYWSDVYTRQLKKGDPYDKLTKTISISILDYELKDSDKLHSVYHIREDETGRKFADVLEIHTIELPKLKRKEAIINENPDFIGLMKFIATDDKEERKMLAEQRAKLIEIEEIMDSLSDDDDTWYSYLSRARYLRDQISREYRFAKIEERAKIADERLKAAEEGLKAAEEGLKAAEEGLKAAEEKAKDAEEKAKAAEEELKIKEEDLEKQVNINVAKNMLKNGLDKSTISECTGLSFEEIDALIWG